MAHYTVWGAISPYTTTLLPAEVESHPGLEPDAVRIMTIEADSRDEAVEQYEARIDERLECLKALDRARWEAEQEQSRRSRGG